MKYILTLSLNYVKRQKFRTVLTFLGVMLASFIMGMSMFVANSLFSSYKNLIFDEFGSWEVSLDGVFSKAGDKDDALKKLQENVLVENLFYFKQTRLLASANGYLTDDDNCLQITLNDDDPLTVARFSQFNIVGDESVMGNFGPLEMNAPEAENGIIVPAYLKNAGYSEGDTVRVTAVPVKDGVRGVSVTGSFVIEGFIFSVDETGFGMSVSDNCRFGEELYEKNPEIFTTGCYSDATAVFRINDNADFEESVKAVLYEVFGDAYTYEDLYADNGLNGEVLILELKTLVKVGDFIIIAAFVFAFVFLVWLVARFIIDNTFEISVAERNRKYSLLRTIGASKGQLSALTAFEAMFYCLTAVPSGVLVSYLIVKNLFVTFAKSGVSQAVFEVHPLVTAWVFLLCIVSVFISSYTSALWATRKMTLVDAMNYGVSGRNLKKAQKIKKTVKLHRSPSGFIKLYTKRNIERTKGKFIFSVFAGSVSVIMLVSMIMSSVLMGDIFTTGDSHSLTDYEYYNLNNMTYREISEYFDDENFAALRFRGNNSYMKLSRETSSVKAKYIDSETAAAFESLAGKEIAEYQFGVLSEGCFSERVDSVFGVYSAPGKKVKSLAEFSEKSYEKFRDSDESILVVLGSTGNRYRGFSRPTVINADGHEYRISGIFYLKNEYGIPGMDTAFVLTAAENAQDIVFENASMTLQFAGTETCEKCYEICHSFEKKYAVHYASDMYLGGTGALGFMKAGEKTELVFFVFLWLTGIVSMINLTNTRIMNSQREYFIYRCTGMTKKQLVKCALQEVIIFAVLSTVTGIITGFLFFMGLMGGTAMIQESLSDVTPAETLKYIAEKTLVPVTSAALFSLATNIVIPVAFASPLIKRFFTTSAEIVNSNDLR